MSTINPIWYWIGFNVFVLAMLAIDLGVFHRKSHKVSLREALTWSVVWMALALLFNAGLYVFSSSELALQFLTGYLIEKSLSVDNIFVFVLIFSAFSVPTAYQHRVLFWGILGALVMRGIMITVGTVLLDKFHWILYIFGGFLILTAIKMAKQKEIEVNPEQNPFLKFVRRFVPVTKDYEQDRFLTRRSGRIWATPLLLALLVVETTDLLFAVDSIPAIFAVTEDPFIVYTSNVFAILGLRAPYFAIANIISQFYYLKTGLAVILAFVGLKMILAEKIYHIPTWLSLLVIALVLTIALLASIIRARRLTAKKQSGQPAPPENTIIK